MVSEEVRSFVERALLNMDKDAEPVDTWNIEANTRYRTSTVVIAFDPIDMEESLYKRFEKYLVALGFGRVPNLGSLWINKAEEHVIQRTDDAEYAIKMFVKPQPIKADVFITSGDSYMVVRG